MEQLVTSLSKHVLCALIYNRIKHVLSSQSNYYKIIINCNGFCENVFVLEVKDSKEKKNHKIKLYVKKLIWIEALWEKYFIAYSFYTYINVW